MNFRFSNICHITLIIHQTGRAFPVSPYLSDVDASESTKIIGNGVHHCDCTQVHYVSKELWTPEVEEELACQHEEGNLNNVRD